jgi:heme oxygenase
MDTSSRRFILRDRTAAAHQALDGMIGPLKNRAVYDGYARGLHAFRTSIEPVIAALAGDVAGSDWTPCRIAGELEQDLHDLDLPPQRLEPAPKPASRDEAIGYLYVLEGSAMGARLLVKHAEALGLREDWGARHLFKQTSAPASHWRSFVAALDAPGLHTEDMVRGAQLAFELARTCLT